MAVSELDLEELARTGLHDARADRRGDRQPAKAAKPGYGVQRHGDKLTELEREAIARMMQEED